MPRAYQGSLWALLSPTWSPRREEGCSLWLGPRACHHRRHLTAVRQLRAWVLCGTWFSISACFSSSILSSPWSPWHRSAAASLTAGSAQPSASGSLTAHPPSLLLGYGIWSLQGAIPAAIRPTAARAGGAEFSPIPEKEILRLSPDQMEILLDSWPQGA